MPKVLHYVWVGHNKLSSQARRCIASWQRFMPEYQIILWNEANSPMDHPYVKAMYAKKKWAFVSDYIRFWALFHQGGIYLDTDTEVLRSLNPLLEHEVFFGRTSSDDYVSCGIIGAQPQNPFIRNILDAYDAMGNQNEYATSPQTVTRVYNGYVNKDAVTVYPPQYFYPCGVDEKCTPEKLREAYTNHHWDESWMRFRFLRKLARKLGIVHRIKNISLVRKVGIKLGLIHDISL